MKKSTKKQVAKIRIPMGLVATKTVLPFIKKFYAKNGYMPSTREIAEGCGRTSAEWGRLSIRLLEDQGYLTAAKGKFRSIKLTEKNV